MVPVNHHDQFRHPVDYSDDEEDQEYQQLQNNRQTFSIKPPSFLTFAIVMFTFMLHVMDTRKSVMMRILDAVIYYSFLVTYRLIFPNS